MKNIFIALVSIILLAVYSVAIAAECPLCDAAYDGNLSEVERLLDNEADANAMDEFGGTPLILAAWSAQSKVAKLLLDNGANVHYETKDGWTALMWAALNDNAQSKVMKKFLNGKTKVESGTWHNQVGGLYNDSEVAKILLAHGANENHKNKDWALMVVARDNQSELAKILLLDNDTNVNYKNIYGWTALMLAVHYDHIETTRILLQYGANPDITNKDGENAWDLAEGKKAILAIFEKKFPQQNNITDSEYVFENAWPSIVYINTDNGQGSGVIIEPNVVATNCHVVANSNNIQVYKAEKKQTNREVPYNAIIFEQDNDNDFCLLSVNGLQGQPAVIRKYNTINNNEFVYALGAPQGLDLSVSQGVVSRLQKIDGKRFIQTDAAMSPGSSGGGLFDSEGKLIGIITHKISHIDIEGVGFAIPADLAL